MRVGRDNELTALGENKCGVEATVRFVKAYLGVGMLR